MAWSSEGDYIAAVMRPAKTRASEWRVMVYQGASGRLLMQHSHNASAAIVWSPLGAYLLVAGLMEDGLGYLLDVVARTNEAVLAGCVMPCWSPNAQFWVTKRMADDGEHLTLVSFAGCQSRCMLEPMPQRWHCRTLSAWIHV